MTKEKTNLIDKLYTLRAGVSLVAEQAEIIDDYKNAGKKRICELENEINASKENIESHKSSFAKKCEGYEKEKSDFNKTIKNGENLVKPKKITMKTCVIICISIWLPLALTLVLGLMDIMSTGELIGVIIGCVLLLGLLILFCKFIMLSVINGDYEKSFLEYERKRAEYEQNCKKEPIINAEINEKINISRDEMNKSIEKENQKIKVLTASMDEIREKTECKIQEYKIEGKKIYESLIEQFNNILDIRDWESIDFIIYLLETGRAETVKEALQQLDFHRQTDKIADVVNNASKAICENISFTAKRAEETISSCASRISTQLDGINGRLNGISIFSAMQSLLLLKSTLTSTELLKRVRVVLR